MFDGSDSLVTVGMLLYTAGVMKSVHEEWAEHGLTDTSYTSLWLWCLGSLSVFVWSCSAQPFWVSIPSVIPVLVYGRWLGTKLHDGLTISRRRRC